MRLSDLLKIEKGVTAVIGSGGKTSLIHALAKELPGRVILCTTTLIYPSKNYFTLISPVRDELETALQKHGVVCAGEPAGNGKIKALKISMETLAEMVDYVLVEADGAKHRPLKAHEALEPVIPGLSNQTICVVGALGFDVPIAVSAHRPERFAALAGVSADDPAAPEMAAKVIEAEGFTDRIFINQVETKAALEKAKRLAQNVNCPVIAGSINSDQYDLIKA